MRKSEKVAIRFVFPMVYSSGGSKRRLAKAAGAEPSGQMMKDCTPLLGETHFSKSKVLKTDSIGALLEVEMSKKCRELWCQAHFEVKSVKLNTPHARTMFESSVFLCGSRKGLCTSTRHSFATVSTKDTITLHDNYNYITLHSTSLHYTQLHYTTIQYTTLHYTTLHHTTLHCTTLHYTTLHYITLHCTALH